MRTLNAFTHVSLDGYYTDPKGDMSWAHKAPDDAEWNEFVAGNASGNGALLFGRVTYDMMAGYWPSAMAAEHMPAVAAGMNAMPKYVASRTLSTASWNNTTLLTGDLATEIRRLKLESGPALTTLGSGSVVAQLAAAGLVDSFQVIVDPVVLGAGRSMFAGVTARLKLRLINSRTFGNGAVMVTYEPA